MKAIYPGSFDPVTFGHLDVIKRAVDVFGELTVLVCVNSAKPAGMFLPAVRADLIRQSVQALGIENVNVDHWGGLVAEYAASHDCRVLVKGLRAVSDYESEAQMAMANMALGGGLETMFFHARPEHAYLSSSFVKELARHGADVSAFVPACVAESMKSR